MKVPKNDRALRLRIRANYRCEYCRRDLAGEIYELDHIVPQFLGGDDEDNNLVVSCARCNRNKGTRIRFVDPHTRALVRIFNPRIDSWDEHFKDTAFGELAGKTPIGRATAALLFRSTPQLIPPDLSWDKIDDLQRNERLYRFLNELRFRRLRNEFTILTSGLSLPWQDLDSSPLDLEVAQTAKDLLLLEMLMMRSTPQDVEQGIRLGTRMLKKATGKIHKELNMILSILYQQRATIRYCSGDTVGALSDQSKAGQLNRPYGTSSAEAVVNQIKLRDYLRDQGINRKYVGANFGRRQLTNLLHASIDLSDDTDYRHLVYLADLAIYDESADFKTLEAIYLILTEILESGGYAQTMDQAKFVTLRRRWWVVHLLLENNPWIDALRADLLFWQELEMHNEIRELGVSILRITRRLKPRIRKAVRELLSRSSFT